MVIHALAEGNSNTSEKMDSNATSSATESTGQFPERPTILQRSLTVLWILFLCLVSAIGGFILAAMVFSPITE